MRSKHSIRRATHLTALVSLLVLVTLLGLETHQPVVAQAGIRFAVIGDFGSEGPNEAAVAALVQSWNPDFIITTGDNNYTYGEASTIDPNIGQYYHNFIAPYYGSYGAGAATNRFFPSLGNHDWETTGAQPYLDYFTLPGNERYYDFVWGPVHFFAVDSDPHEPDGVTSTSIQGNWLQNRLAASTAPWKLVYMHHPPYSSGSHGNSPEMQWPYAAWGATAVLAGHDHDYERLLINNFPYFVNGLGGRSLRRFRSTLEPGSMAQYRDDYGAMLVEASSDRITFYFYSITGGGTLIDSYTIEGTGGAPIDTPVPTSAPPPGVTPVGQPGAVAVASVPLAAPLCADFSGTTNAIVRADVPSGTVTDGSVFCRVIAENSSFVHDPAEIGNMDVLNRGVIQAVDVFGMTHSGAGVSNFNSSVKVCLSGAGSVMYLNATTQPRALSELPTTQEGGYTCALIPNAGTVVLVQ
ncbi:MAG TPA: metallophosphoesterase [Syntrophorhabdaceae bacterium]|nr:metallophosphoesterase [Syntrophorhabdaceae bacterium]